VATARSYVHNRMACGAVYEKTLVVLFFSQRSVMVVPTHTIPKKAVLAGRCSGASLPFIAEVDGLGGLNCSGRRLFT